MKNNKLNNDFKVPTNYFENLENEIFLKTLKEKESFNVPKDYFLNLEQKINANNLQTKTKKSKQFYINKWFAAASIILILVVTFQFIGSNKKEAELVNTKMEEEVYEKIYDSYIVSEDIKKSPNNVSLDDSDFVLYTNY
ncbi:hypothetical protein SAMN05443634_104323 [Chishuiella changwenlii]|uniref:Uncharacterized protein n=1 Tax=Chishuiella changwenlii TaxID=1434701 RepID=A0A1M6WIM9_9FLAO|nr:hypothetical protein [Chishuiella changwenlii]GGF04715.1 hypothetical protein GCM10010984_22490 [Chishuiella changwenlii]SHK93476.1 hypothetical protein SAMN05443634_104323 [Chishuiella changwenlii]